MARKDHTEVAARIRDGALGLFQQAHDELIKANETLAAGSEVDVAEKERLLGRIANAHEQQQANERVITKLKDFVGV